MNDGRASGKWSHRLGKGVSSEVRPVGRLFALWPHSQGRHSLVPWSVRHSEAEACWCPKGAQPEKQWQPLRTGQPGVQPQGQGGGLGGRDENETRQEETCHSEGSSGKASSELVSQTADEDPGDSTPGEEGRTERPMMGIRPGGFPCNRARGSAFHPTSHAKQLLTGLGCPDPGVRPVPVREPSGRIHWRLLKD